MEFNALTEMISNWLGRNTTVNEARSTLKFLGKKIDKEIAKQDKELATVNHTMSKLESERKRINKTLTELRAEKDLITK